MDIVLVHGAWHGAWCWERLVPELERYGATVYAPDLPIDQPFDACVDVITATLDDCDGPALLVGHSMGGALISQAAEYRHELIERLIFIAAFAPSDGESVNSLGHRNLASALRGNVAPDEQGLLVVDKGVAPAAFYADCDDETAEAAIQRLRPQHESGFSQKVVLTAGKSGACSRQYIECIEDQAVHVSAQRQMAVACGCTHINSMRTSHSPFLSAPVELAGLILTSGPPPHGEQR